MADAASVCRKAAGYFDRGAGASHSVEARALAKSMALWLAGEFDRMAKEGEAA